MKLAKVLLGSLCKFFRLMYLFCGGERKRFLPKACTKGQKGQTERIFLVCKKI